MQTRMWKKYIQLNFSALIFILFSIIAFANDITADDFRGSRLRGFVIGGISNGLRSDSDLDALASTGANVARVFITLNRCNTCNTYEIPTSILKTLDKLISNLASRSINVVIVIEAKGDDSRGILWNSSELQNSLVNQWKIVAKRYKGVSNIAGFDLLNEPVPPGQLPNYSDRQLIWLEFAEKVGFAIRSIDPKRVLIVESAPDSTPTSFKFMKPLSLSNVVYSFHSYLPIQLTHQGVMKDFNTPLTYGSVINNKNDNISKQELISLLKNVELFANKYKVPILVGEFSCVRWSPEKSAQRYISDSLAYFEAQGWSWTYHEFRGWHGWDAEMDSEVKTATSRSDSSSILQLLRNEMKKNNK